MVGDLDDDFEHVSFRADLCICDCRSYHTKFGYAYQVPERGCEYLCEYCSDCLALLLVTMDLMVHEALTRRRGLVT